MSTVHYFFPSNIIDAVALCFVSRLCGTKFKVCGRVDDVIACVISCELVQHVPQVTHPPQRWRSAAEGPHLKTDQQRSPIRAHAGRHGRAAVLLPTVVRPGAPASRKESTR